MPDPVSPFATATEMLRALAAREVSAVELAELHVARIDALDEPLNAVPVRTPERARAAAAEADRRRLAGDDAPLLGLPMTVKESTQVAGLPQSAGLGALRSHTPTHDGVIAQRLAAAGAGLLGKTNIPVALGDWQADSPVYGRTVNPWDATRTPGGSTGGGGAALAAGLTPLEVGSDIGGSIRVPAAYCGVYGHRPSLTVVPRTGVFPHADLPNPAAVMGVQGPLARSAHDLELLLDVIAGPDVGEDAWRLALPPARGAGLADLRVAIMPPTPLAQPSAAMAGRVDELAAHLRAAGTTVAEAMPEIDQRAYFRDYLVLLTVLTGDGRPLEVRVELAERFRDVDADIADALAEGARLTADGLSQLLRRRAAAQQRWAEFFRDWDVLVCPTALDSAFEHRGGSQHERMLDVDGTTVPYMRNIVYPMWAIFAGLPATAFPAGNDARGLPIGLQAVGPSLEDRTPLRFAQLLEADWHRFVAPAGW